MPDKYREYKDELNRRNYMSKSLAELKRIAKKPKHGLLNVDQYTKADKNKLVERLVKGKQLEDESKEVLLKKAKADGLKVNASMSKNDLIQKIRNPELKDLNKKRLEILADQKGIRLRSQLTNEGIIQRLENPLNHYTKESLNRLARDNNLDIPRNVNTKQELIDFLLKENIITSTPIKAQESNLAVSSKDIPESLRRVAKKKGRNARERLEDFKNYLKDLKRDYFTPAGLRKLAKQLNEEEAKKEKERIFTPILEKSAFKKFTNQYVINGAEYYDPISFLEDATPAITNIMISNQNTKIKLCLNCIMKRVDSDGFVAEREFAFHSIGDKIITKETDVYEIYQEMIDEIEGEIQKTENAEGSGWVFMKIKSLVLHTMKWDPVNAGSYIDLPPFLKNKKAIINMKNEDDKCFMWCVLRALNPKDKNAERIDGDLRSKEDTINMNGIEYPVELQKIIRFEHLNPNISISVLGYNGDKSIYPLGVSMCTRAELDIVLL